MLPCQHDWAVQGVQRWQLPQGALHAYFPQHRILVLHEESDQCQLGEAAQAADLALPSLCWHLHPMPVLPLRHGFPNDW